MVSLVVGGRHNALLETGVGALRAPNHRARFVIARTYPIPETKGSAGIRRRLQLPPALLAVALGTLIAAAFFVGLRPSPVSARGSGGMVPPQLTPVIVLDPGHGGTETGAVGSSGLTEKTVSLDIARRLRQLIEARLGFRVILTREDDRDMPLDARTELANFQRAALFVSIHANAYRGRLVSGPETYFLSENTTADQTRTLEEHAEVTAEEMAEATEDQTEAESLPEDPELQLLLWDMAQTMHLRESSALADLIQRELNLLSNNPGRGVKQAPFRVLGGATMPAVLVEVGFLSNPDDESRLGTSGYRQAVAEALYRSLSRFRRRLASLSVPSRP